MKVTPDIIRYEFIGTQAKVTESNHQGYVGISGEIIDETRNTFLIVSKGKRKRIIKDSAVFHFNFSDGTTVEIDGRLLVRQPAGRLKKSITRLW